MFILCGADGFVYPELSKKTMPKSFWVQAKKLMVLNIIKILLVKCILYRMFMSVYRRNGLEFIYDKDGSSFKAKIG